MIFSLFHGNTSNVISVHWNAEMHQLISLVPPNQMALPLCLLARLGQLSVIHFSRTSVRNSSVLGAAIQTEK